jgi:FkbM family methyltransferase
MDRQPGHEHRPIEYRAGAGLAGSPEQRAMSAGTAGPQEGATPQSGEEGIGHRSTLAKLRPAKISSALRRRWFEWRVPRLKMREVPGVIHLGGSYGGWMMPGELIDSSWTCYLVGAGGDVSFDLELIDRYGVIARSFEAVEDYVVRAREQAGDEPRFGAHHAAIAAVDGPIRMQVTHDPGSLSVSAAQLYDSSRFIEMPGRSLTSLMAEFGDERIDLLKIDIEGSEYEVLPTIDLRALGVKIFAIQLHHTGSVRDARRLIAGLRAQGYEPVACRSSVKLTFALSELL